MRLLECMRDHEKWLEFLQYKIESGHMPKTRMEELRNYIEEKRYIDALNRFCSENDSPYPQVRVLNKKNTNKKRVVFTYDTDENYVLMMMSYLLYEYDTCLMPNVYSFRRDTGVKKAIKTITAHPDIDRMYSYKVDIQDYFNSVDIEKLLPLLQGIFVGDMEAYEFLSKILCNPYVYREGELLEMKKGIMAGVPVSAFLANVYLTEMDRYFYENNILYARYSDDIIVFDEDVERLKEHAAVIEKYLQKYHLAFNESKCQWTSPGETWEYLGFSYNQGKIDVSEATFQKLKAKLKRKARAIYRWKVNNQKKDEYAVRAYIKHLNRKFFHNPIHNEITWCRWYLPIINTPDTLKEIDAYIQQNIRYIVTGRYSKSNYNYRYETMKDLGLRSLVNEYYK